MQLNFSTENVCDKTETIVKYLQKSLIFSHKNGPKELRGQETQRREQSAEVTTW